MTLAFSFGDEVMHRGNYTVAPSYQVRLLYIAKTTTAILSNHVVVLFSSHRLLLTALHACIASQGTLTYSFDSLLICQC